MSDFGTYLGYRRENGAAGCRNHVLVLPVDDLSNAAVEAVANHVEGTLAIPHPYGRLQFGPDLELHFRTLIGVGSNPYVAAVVVIGIEPNWTKRIADGIAKTGKPVESSRSRATVTPQPALRPAAPHSGSCVTRAVSDWRQQRPVGVVHVDTVRLPVPAPLDELEVQVEQRMERMRHPHGAAISRVIVLTCSRRRDRTPTPRATTDSSNTKAATPSASATPSTNAAAIRWACTCQHRQVPTIATELPRSSAMSRNGGLACRGRCAEF